MRIQSVMEAEYPHVGQAGTGGPTFPAFAVANEAAGQQQPNQRHQFGDSVVDKHGNVFCYVRAAGNLVEGDVVKQAVSGDGDVPAEGTISANTTTRLIYSSITTTIAESSLVSYLVSNGTTPFTRRIKGLVAIGANTTFIISKIQTFFGIGKYDGDDLAVTPTTSDAVGIFRPYNVVVCGAAAASQRPVGVSLGTVTAASGTLIQVQGLAVVKVDGSTSIAKGNSITTGASGVGIAMTSTPTAQEVLSILGIATMTTAVNSAKKVGVLLQLINKL